MKKEKVKKEKKPKEKPKYSVSQNVMWMAEAVEKYRNIY